VKTITLKTALVRFHWNGGRIDEQDGVGNNRTEIAADAANKLGYGGGAMSALDYWEIVEDEKEGVSA
jgi:hypothetical protein